MEILVSTRWLSDQLGVDDLVVLDASAHLPATNRDPAAEFEAGHIPVARFLDLPSLKDQASKVPAALPNASQFAARVRELGINASDRVVLYDDSVLRSPARAFFIFKLFGFENVAILDGGLAKWRAEGRALESRAEPVESTDLKASQETQRSVRSKSDMLENCSTQIAQVIDARDGGRFTGKTEDTVHGLPGGHIPGSRNLHFTKLLLREDGTFKDKAAMQLLFEDAGIDLSKPIIASCGSGMTASVLLFALELLGHRHAALYDGSWSEWGADPDTPKETGPAQ